MIKKPDQHIKSFVLRQGHMSEGQRKALSEEWSSFGLNLQDHFLDFEHIFSSPNPVILEIGFGNGDTLLHLAEHHPDKNFIGIDVHKPGLGSLLLKLKKQALTNVRVFCADAIEVLKNTIPDESLEAIYVLFPDPWPKRRHNKRRIVQPDFVKLTHQKLILGGKLHLATDWKDYAQHMSAVMSQNSGFKPTPIHTSRPITKFETRGKNLGHGIWDFIFEKQ